MDWMPAECVREGSCIQIITSRQFLWDVPECACCSFSIPSYYKYSKLVSDWCLCREGCPAFESWRPCWSFIVMVPSPTGILCDFPLKNGKRIICEISKHQNLLIKHLTYHLWSCLGVHGLTRGAEMGRKASSSSWTSPRVFELVIFESSTALMRQRRKCTRICRRTVDMGFVYFMNVTFVSFCLVVCPENSLTSANPGITPELLAWNKK